MQGCSLAPTPLQPVVNGAHTPHEGKATGQATHDKHDFLVPQVHAGEQAPHHGHDHAQDRAGRLKQQTAGQTQLHQHLPVLRYGSRET